MKVQQGPVTASENVMQKEEEALSSRRYNRIAIAALAAACAFAPSTHAQTVSMFTVVDLALRNSPEVRMAEADVRRAAAGLAETRDAYLPNFIFASNLGYSYGFPVGQPSVLNAQSNSLVFSFAQPDYIRSARAATDAARLSLTDTRQKVILEAALGYIELDTDQKELAALHDQQEYGKRLISIEEDRVLAGLDGRVEATQARLTNARLRLRQLELEGHAEVLAAKLSHLDGLPPTRIATDSQSIPAAPDNALLTRPVDQNVGVQAAYASAKSKLFVSFGDDRQEYRPTLGLGIQYSRYAKFNNYDLYYNRFQHNNFGIGVNISIPLFDEARHQHARGSAADAVHSMAQADMLRNQVSEQELELSRNLDTLAAQQDVARLQQELAQDQLNAVLIQLQGGSGHPGAAPITPRDEQQARMDERRFAIDLLDSNFQLIQAQLNLLRTRGLVEAWAMHTPAP